MKIKRKVTVSVYSKDLTPQIRKQYQVVGNWQQKFIDDHTTVKDYELFVTQVNLTRFLEGYYMYNSIFCNIFKAQVSFLNSPKVVFAGKKLLKWMKKHNIDRVVEVVGNPETTLF